VDAGSKIIEGLIDPRDNFPIPLPLEREQEGEADLVPEPS